MKQLILILSIILVFLGCKPPEARVPETVQSGSFLKESAERNRKLNEQENTRIKRMIKAHPKVTYIASESGFWYYYNKQIITDTIQPQFGDTVKFSYSVANIDGEEIYPNKQKTYVMDKEVLFSGLREGLKLMKPEEQITFIFPSQKAYGYYGDDNKIGTNIPLICKVTLNSIHKNND